MRFSLFILLSIFSYNFSYSQYNLGHKYDINGILLNQTLNPFTYQPYTKLDIIHYSDSYEKAYYFDNNGNKVNGFIKFTNEKISFKTNSESKVSHFWAGEINNFVIGIDSFFTITNYYHKNIIKTNNIYVQYISSFDSLTFVKHYKFNSNSYNQNYGKDPVIESYLVKSSNSQYWEPFTNMNKSSSNVINFKERALKYFGHIPYLKDKISTYEYRVKHLMLLIKTCEYHSKYLKKEPIYYNKYWQDLNLSKDSYYYSKIVSYSEGDWTLDYYKDSIKLYTATYSSLYPNEKNGDFIVYYKNGSVKEKSVLRQDKLRNVKSYTKEGILELDYDYDYTSEHNYDGEIVTKIKYNYISKGDSNNLIDQKRNFILTKDDPIYNENYYYKYVDNELKTSYRIENGDTIFLVTDNTISIEPIRKALMDYISEETYTQAVKDNTQGHLLLYLRIDEKGKVIDGELLNKLHPSVDDPINKFIRFRIKSDNYPLKIKPYKTGRVKQNCEVIIPIEFAVIKFYRAPSNNAYFYNHWHWHNFHLQQMHQMNQIRNIQPPNFPRGF